MCGSFCSFFFFLTFFSKMKKLLQNPVWIIITHQLLPEMCQVTPVGLFLQQATSQKLM